MHDFRYLNDKGYKGGLEKSAINTINPPRNQPKLHDLGSKPLLQRLYIGMNDIHAISEFEQSLGKMNPEIALSAAQAVFLSDWRSILPPVQVPTTIIQSKTDYIVPEKDMISTLYGR
uniref:Uncharacterized protein n=1 Tax=Opuntia streptacantha TaxID=393608 RepID=A0A7C8YL05_OPUST